MPTEISNSGRLKKNISKLEIALTTGLIVAGNRAALRAVSVQRKLRPDTIATGQTIRSHTVSRVMRNGPELFVLVGPRTAYAKWGIGTGRAPGRPPPLQRIIEWVREKPGGFGLPTEQQFAIALAVQRKIKLHGTEAYNVLEIALREEKDTVTSILVAAMRAQLLA